MRIWPIYQYVACAKHYKSPPVATTTGWIARPSARQQASEALELQIQGAFTASDATCGMPRVRAQLRGEGIIAHKPRDLLL